MSSENSKDICLSENYPTMKKCYDVNNVKPVSIPWLNLTSVYPPRNVNEKGLFTKLNEPYNESLWNLVQYSMPPFLDAKYHNMNIAELSKNPLNNILCSTKFVMWSEAMGLPLLNLIKIKILKYKWSKNQSEESLEDWRVEVDNIVDSLKLIWTEPDLKTPIKVDLCSNSAEFLLEPCILIQLPSQPVLLHQWLTTALAEILLFEKESVDFRHWPLCKTILKITGTLFRTIRIAKTLIMQGFGILNEILISYPEIPPLFSNVILDTILLCIPKLEFLSTKKYEPLFKILRKNSWLDKPKFGNVNKLSYITRTCYQVFEATYTVFPFSIDILNVETMQIPTEKSHEIDKNNKSLKESKPSCDDNKTSKKLSLDEKYILNLVENNQNLEKLDCEERCELTVRVIQEKVISTGKLPGVTIQNVEKIFHSPQAKIQAENIFNENSTDNTVNAIRHSMMYNEISKQLIDSEKENSAAAQIIRLQLEILEKEQIARLTNTCRLIFKINIVAKKYDHDAVKKVLNSLSLIDKNKINHTTLWTKFPEEWKKSVNITEEIPSIDSNFDDRIKSFEIRIGRLVYNIAKDSYNLSGKNIYRFSGWNIVQYILPCLAAKYLNDHKVDNLETLQNLHEIISIYEMLYNKWKTECKSKLIINIYKELEISTLEINYFWQLINSNLQSYINKLEPQNIITNILQNIHSWYLMCPETSCFIFIIILNKYNEFVNKFTQDILEITAKHHKLPEVCKHPELGELYFASAVLSDIEVLYSLEQLVNFNTKIMPSTINSDFCDILEKVLSLNDTTDKNELVKFIEEKKNKLLLFYETIKTNIQDDYETIFFEKVLLLLPNSKCNLLIENAVFCYLKGNFNALENILTILFPKILKIDKKCRNCSEQENNSTKFLMCYQCVCDKNYPDVNYFCGKDCEYEWWEKEHKAEHLEFELGLSNSSAEDVLT